MDQFEYKVSIRLARRYADEEIRKVIVRELSKTFGVPEHSPEGHGHKPYPSITVEKI